MLNLILGEQIISSLPLETNNYLERIVRENNSRLLAQLLGFYNDERE